MDNNSTPKPLTKKRKWDKMEHFHARLSKTELTYLKLQALGIRMQREKKRGVQREYITANSVLRAAIRAYMMLSPGLFINKRLDHRNINTEEDLIKRVVFASQRKPLSSIQIKKATETHYRKILKMIGSKYRTSSEK